MYAPLKEATVLRTFLGWEEKCLLLFFSLLLTGYIRQGPSLGSGLSSARKAELKPKTGRGEALKCSL